MRILSRGGIYLRSDCGGTGTCGKCLVLIANEGLFGAEASLSGSLSAGGDAGDPPHKALACQTRVTSDLMVSIPLSSFGNAEVMSKPSVGPALNRQALKAGSMPKGFGLGLAVDVGTTTIAVYLFDRERREVIAEGCVRNAQSLFGDDVMSRIASASLAKENLELLQSLALIGINSTLESMARECGVATDRIDEVAVVGNPTMIHLLLGVDPSSMGVYPYEPPFTRFPLLSGSKTGLQVNPEATIKILPLISGFIGSDILAGAGAVALQSRDPGTMLIDMGTNGEIMLKTEQGILATSCATGPALEGATIRCGMHGVSGAIEAVEIDPVSDSVRVTIIERNPDNPRKAAGICGSGIVSAVAALLRVGILEPDGRLGQTKRHPNLRRGEKGQMEFLLVPGEATETGDDIVLTQADIRSVQLAKAALITGILSLCRLSGVDCPERILVAGAFGHHMNKRDAMRVGLLPEVPEERVETFGNAAGLGALLSLADPSFDESLEEIAGRCRTVDLASLPDFQSVFVDALRFPTPLP
jgi:uncharacterized 2Fe-2S/4Fe-4S cluster protein (DUF4445 family)